MIKLSNKVLGRQPDILNRVLLWPMRGSRELEGTKVGLLLPLVGYRAFDTLLSFTPDLATDVSPQQVALI